VSAASGSTIAVRTKVRAAAPEDAALVLQITLTAWQGKVHPSSSVFRETVSDVAQQLVEGGGCILYIAEAPVGSVRFSPVPGAWEVRRMGVLPEHRGQGLALAMMNSVVAEAVRRSVSELRLAVRHDQPRLVEFYAGMGFVPAPEIEYAHANPASPPPTVMRRALARSGA
jgi:ribosomal protein S18 acetylase RimI-like enzyme